MNTISIIGAGGFIGKQLSEFLSKKGQRNYRIEKTFRSENSENNSFFLDITDKKQLEEYLLFSSPQWIIFVAGCKDVGWLQSHSAQALEINTYPVKNLVQILKKHKIHSKIIFLSSDYVFDGSSGYYKDSDDPRPLTHYGKSKLLAEQALLNSDLEVKIVRTSAVLGLGGQFFDWLLQSLKNNTPVKLYKNVYFSPTPIDFLDEIIFSIIENEQNHPEKILHVVGEKRLSRYELGKIVAGILKISPEIILEENLDFKKSLLQPDLSMIPSKSVSKRQTLSLEDNLKILVDY